MKTNHIIYGTILCFLLMCCSIRVDAQIITDDYSKSFDLEMFSIDTNQNGRMDHLDGETFIMDGESKAIFKVDYTYSGEYDNNMHIELITITPGKKSLMFVGNADEVKFVIDYAETGEVYYMAFNKYDEPLFCLTEEGESFSKSKYLLWYKVLDFDIRML